MKDLPSLIKLSPSAETTIGPTLQAKRSSLTIPGARRARLPDRARMLSRWSGVVL